ncbi:hypothetical protein J6590_015066 [Homalodisca vitripennis]|nr:hypothetical protein J6590_015066 [Homalodisca vitripennis]
MCCGISWKIWGAVRSRGFQRVPRGREVLNSCGRCVNKTCFYGDMSEKYQLYKAIQRLSQDNRIKQRRAWLLLGWVIAKRSCPCKQPASRPLVVVRKSPFSRWSLG